jgi:hypothetical protein
VPLPPPPQPTAMKYGMLLRDIMDMRIVESQLRIAGKMKIGLQMMNGNKIPIFP